MEHFEFGWKQHGVTFYAQGWKPENPKAVVCIVHGFSEHSGRYAHVAERLAKAGFATAALDNFGHGKTSGKAGHSPSYEATMDSIAQLLDEAEKLFPGSKKFLWGHSMGGGYVVNYVLRRQPEIAGAIFGSPLFKMSFSPPAYKIVLAKIMNRIFPAFTQKAALIGMDISRDPEIVRTYLKDELNHGKMAAGTFIGLYEAGRWAMKNADKLSIPALLMHGTEDRLTSYKASAEFAASAPKDLLTFKTWEGFFHELHNEPEPDRTTVINYVIDWMFGVMNTKVSK